MPSSSIFLDEDLPRKAETLLLSLGYDVAYVPTVRLKGLKNGELLARATREKRILITRDKGFLRKGRYPAGTHHGVIVVRLRIQNTANLLLALEDLLDAVPLTQVVGRVLVLTEDGHFFHD